MAKKIKKQTPSKVTFNPHKIPAKVVRKSIRIPTDVSRELKTVLKTYNANARKNKKRTISMNSLMIKCFVSKVNSARI